MHPKQSPFSEVERVAPNALGRDVRPENALEATRSTSNH